MLQLVYSSGSQDMIFTGTGNPEISFFKNVFKQHSKFAMDNLTLPTSRTTCNLFRPTEARCKIERNGDLVTRMYLTLDLPAVFCDGTTRPNFRWVPNLAEAMIDHYHLMIGGSVVDKQYGEWLHIWSELNVTADKREIYNQMIGNSIDMYEPDNNTFYNAIIPLQIKKFPVSSGYDQPTIAGRRLYVPLNFWFCTNPALALPLVALLYAPVEVVIVLRPIVHVYQLFYAHPRTGALGWYAPIIEDPTHHIAGYLDPAQALVVSDSVVNFKLALEVTYVVLDVEERTYFGLKPIDYLMTQLTRVDVDGIVENNTITIPLMNPVTEVFWVLKRSDAKLKNEWFNYTNPGSRSIMNSAKLMMNGYDRTQEKDARYFEIVQPYENHSASKKGVYCYSFALYPTQTSQPSGHANMSRIKKFQLFLNVVPPPEDVSYTLSFYAVNTNFLRVGSGLAAVMYSG